MTIRFSARWRTTALALAALACTERDTTDLGPVAGGGTGGSSLALAGAGGGSESAGAAGMAGAAGAPDQLPDAGTVSFRARLEGERVAFEVLGNAWHFTCHNDPLVLQKRGDDWEPLRDERPTGTNEAPTAHYVNGEYVPACFFNPGCHVDACTPIVFDENLVGLDDVLRVSAHEYVRVGERRGPTCEALDAGVDGDAGGDAGTRTVPEIERRVATGPLALRVQYYRDPQCRTAPVTTDVVVE